MVAAGWDHSLALRRDGKVLAWGDNMRGELGLGNTQPDLVQTPAIVDVLGFTSAPVVSVAGGCKFSVALDSNGTVWTWGKGTSGELGNGGTADSSVPQQLTTLPCIREIAAGQDYALARAEDGRVYAWGSNTAGQLGDGTLPPVSSPVPVLVVNPLMISATAIEAGEVHSIGISGTGLNNVYAWGENVSGQLGVNSRDSNWHSSPEQTVSPINPKLSDAVGIDAGNDHSIAVAIEQSGARRVWTWGRNEEYGQIGDNNPANTHQLTPYQVTLPGGNPTVERVAAGFHYSLAVTRGGEIYSWGQNQFGQLGNGALGGSWFPPSSMAEGSPQQVVGPLGVGIFSTAVQAAAGVHHSIALARDCNAFAWGCDDRGQVGVGPDTFTQYLTPQPIAAGPSQGDVIPPDQGNILMGVKSGGYADVLLDWSGAPGPGMYFRIYGDTLKTQLGSTGLNPPVVNGRTWTYGGAVAGPGGLFVHYYRVKGLSPCSLTAGP